MDSRNIENLYPLSPMQQGMLFHSLYAPGSGVYVEMMSCDLVGLLNTNAFVAAWQRLLDRHSILRTAFVWEGVGALEEPLQIVYRHLDIPATVLDWRELSAAGQEARRAELLAAERRRGFDLADAPLLRVHLARVADDRHFFVWTFHHILLDGWSIARLMGEMFALYEGLNRGMAPRLEPTRPYEDYIAWLQEQDRGAAETFWRQTLAGFETPTPLAADRKTTDATQSENYDVRETAFTVAETEALRDLGRRHQLTLNTLFQGAWALLLSHYSREVDVVFGATVSGRPTDLPGAENMVGMFINTLPVRAQLDPTAAAIPWLQSLQARQAEMRQYEYSLLTDIQAWSDAPRHLPLFESILVFENYAVEIAVGPKQGSLQVQGLHSTEQTNYPLTVVVAPGQAATLRIAHDRRRFSPETIDRILGGMRSLLLGLVANPQAQLSQLSLLGPTERQQILFDWNQTARSLPVGANVPGLFAAQVTRTPDAPAVVFEDRTLTYAELDLRANQLAHHLRAQGVISGDFVGIFMDKSPEMIVALLGVLKAGAAYVPIDPAYPPDRIRFMIEESALRVLLTEKQRSEVGSQRSEIRGQKSEVRSQRSEGGSPTSDLGSPTSDLGSPTSDLRSPTSDFGPLTSDLRLVLLNTDGPDIAQHPDTAPAVEVRPDDPAYVIFTSGSTGRPKGVVVPHRALTNHALAMIPAMALTPGDRVLQAISLSFDAAAEEIYPTLLSGAALVLPPSTTDLLGVNLAHFCTQTGITVLHLPASVWHASLDEILAAGEPFAAPVRLLMLGGDAPSVERLHTFAGLLGRDIPVINLYGPTETTITATFFATTTATELDRLPIGRPIANVQTYILDNFGQPTPIGVPGELYIGGEGLALGYLGQPDRTSESFVVLAMRRDPAGTGSRLYRTGDLTRYLPSGDIEFLGRADDQAKIRGYRVEPGEIEAVLSRHPSVQGVAVVVEEDENGQKSLMAYLVAAAGGAPDLADLRAYLGARLPAYMLPSAFIVLPGLPRSPSGKLDRRALAASALAEGVRLVADLYEAPRSPEEEIVAGLWADVLKIERVGIHDNFFELGGHSLLATQLISRVREAFQTEIPLASLFAQPTVAALAETIRSTRDQALGWQAPPITPTPRGVDLPPSFSQQRLWFLDQLEPGNLFYNMPLTVRLTGNLDTDALGRALNEIVRRHEVLRTTFAVSDGRPRQQIAPALTVDLPLTDLSSLPSDQRPAQALRLATAEVRKPFDLARGPLLRAALIRLADDDHIAVLVMHHIVSDAWSLNVLLGELATLYETFRRGQISALTELPIQYVDYAAWQRNWLEGQDATGQSPLQTQLAYWRQQLAGAPARLALPTDRPRPPVQTANGANYGFVLPPELVDNLRELGRDESATLFMTLLAGFQLMLGRYAGQDDVSVGSVIANRTRGETERLIGFFVNTLVLRTDLSGNPTFRDLLARVRQMALASYAHQDVPFEMLVDSLAPERNLSHTPLFQVGFALQNIPTQAQKLTDLTLEPVSVDAGSAKFDITLTLSETLAGLIGSAEYNTDLFDEATLARMMTSYRVLLEAAVADPDQAIGDLPLLEPAERQRVLVDWNQTAFPFPANTTIHALIEQQAATQPDAPAVLFGDQILSYDQLNRRANQLAHHLIGLGVGPESIVGIATQRSPDMIVGILGVLKAGAAYLPIDPAYPPDRIRYMIEDSALRVLLTEKQRSEVGSQRSEIRGQKSEVGSQKPDLGPPTSDLGSPTSDLRLVLLDADWPVIATQPDRNPAVIVSPDNLAYVIYTSGSTGLPKGAMLAHRGLCNLADVQGLAFHIQPGSRVLQFAPLSFDASVWETVMALRNGGALVLAPAEMLAPGPDLLRLLADQSVSTVTLPPSTLAVLEPRALPKLATVISAGEHCSGEIVAAWSQGRAFFDAYGPTETTVCASMYRCDPDRSYPQGPPIGQPIANFQLYIADSNLQPVPIGVPGELLIGGVGVARGYLHRPDLTAERFIPNPFALTPGARLYRSGDLVRYLPDGNIEFLGRIDQQIKIRGFRIELGEIEAALGSHPGIQTHAVIVREDIPGDKRLIAYIVPADPFDPPTVVDLRSHLRQTLPEYMIPSMFVTLDALPMTPANKIDRKALAALPAPDATRPDLEREYVAPNTETETRLVALAADLLHIDRVGIHDNFFDLGGHSLLATQFISRMRDAFGVELPLRTLFEHPTIVELAMQIDIAVTRRDSISPGAESTRPTIQRVSRDARRVSRADIGKPEDR